MQILTNGNSDDAGEVEKGLGKSCPSTTMLLILMFADRDAEASRWVRYDNCVQEAVNEAIAERERD